MTPTTLQALRRLLFFSAPEAGVLIGGVTERSWRFWEDGGRPVPPDVVERVHQLVAWRATAIKNAHAAIDDAHASLLAGTEVDPPVFIWYSSNDDWMTLPGREPTLWRPHCSVIAELCASRGVIAVPFDGPGYSRWLGNRQDSETMRGQWAASTASS